ncbi:hypothetical protein CFBP7900_18880 [Xanthomonas hortorum pv. carotae]|uniref:Secreted protein n=2 Tax=Xanthomonas TaxID=338 RepID=A0A6V7D8V8_9XANT|nr:hypothetical protein CFBP7900_18880 [Xanthomonas hortorum pv. carotae]CAD0330270.1 hypothetical protein CFBP7900_18880 [Xanthomonas hortorum pv. carotae]
MRRRPRIGRCLAAMLSMGLLTLSQTALATKQWNANANQTLNNWISGMYTNITGPLQTLLHQCETAPQATCEVTILANGGVHTSATDDKQHFTLRFTGNPAPYLACHVYPQSPGNTNDKRLQGATCYDAQHNGTYFKLN